LIKNNLSKKDRNLILALFLAGTFMGSMDIGIIGPALPAIEQTFFITSRLSSWMYTGFILFFMLGLPIMAKLSDYYGRRRLYILDIAIFAIGSFMIATSASFEIVLVGRAIQGLGAGGIYPVASAFIGDYFPIENRGWALGMVGSVYGISAICAPLFGALLLGFGWQWLFIINLPIATIIILASMKLLPKTHFESHIKMDWLGLGILAILVSSLAYGINQIDSSRFVESFFSLEVMPFLAIAFILIPLILKIEKRVKEPIIPIHLFKSKEIKLASALSFSYGLIHPVVIFIPSLAIVALFLNSQEASLMMIPYVITTTISAPILGRLLDKIGSKIIIISGTISATFGLILMGLFSGNFYLFIISEILTSYGLIAIVGSPLRYIILSETQAGERGSGQALVNFLASGGQLIGGALIGAIIASFGEILLGYKTAYLFVAIVAIFAFVCASKLKNREEQILAIEQNL